jgi:hypothetical protein
MLPQFVKGRNSSISLFIVIKSGSILDCLLKLYLAEFRADLGE